MEKIGRFTVRILDYSCDSSAPNISIKLFHKGSIIMTFQPEKPDKRGLKDSQKYFYSEEISTKSPVYRLECILNANLGKEEVHLSAIDLPIEDKEDREFDWVVQADRGKKSPRPVGSNLQTNLPTQNGTTGKIKFRIHYQYFYNNAGVAKSYSSPRLLPPKTILRKITPSREKKRPDSHREKDNHKDHHREHRDKGATKKTKDNRKSSEMLGKFVDGKFSEDTKENKITPKLLLKLMESKNLEGIRDFLKQATKEEVNMPVDDQGNSLLHIACIDCQEIPPAILEALLSNTLTDVNFRNKAANTPLHYLCAKWRIPDLHVFDLFLQRGADVKAVNAAGESPVFKAITNRNVRKPILKTLLSAGADPNQVNSHNEGILHYVARQGNEDILKLILTKCQNASLKRKGREGLTPSEIALAEEKKNKERTKEYHRIYLSLARVEELDEFLQEHNLMEHRSFFIEEGLDLDELSNWTEQQIDGLPLNIGPRIKLARGLAEYKKKDVSEDTLLQNQLDKKLLSLQGSTINEQYLEEVRQSLIQMSQAIGQNVVFVQYDQLEFLDELGRGASGAVWKGILRKDRGEERGIEVAIKTLITTSEDYLEEFKKEFMVLHSVNHPNVVKLFGVALKPSLILVMEYCARGSLHHVISNNNNDIGWSLFFSICKEVVLGLQALHSHNPTILHRDLKPLNLLMTEDYHIKVADFGLSLETSARSDMLREQRGTSAYMPPELLRDEKYTTKSDVYSLGIVFWEMLYRVINTKYQRPFAEFPNSSGPNSELMIIFAVSNGLRPTVPATTPPDLAKLVQLCLNAEAMVRPHCSDILVILQTCEDDFRVKPEEWENCIKKE